MHNVLLCDAVVNWCKIFGTNSEECHWKNIVKNHDHFRDYLFDRLSISHAVFTNYQKGMLSFRNKWVAHYDPDHKHKAVPFFEIAHESAVALHSYLRESPDITFHYNGPDDVNQFGQSVAAALFSVPNMDSA